MDKTLLILILTASILLSNCDKSTDPTTKVTPTNCDNLITDTLGTGDTGRIQMPSAFTPNTDGINDLCIPLAVNISSIDFKIFDEANNIVFETTKVGQGWTSAPNSNTKYYYRIQAITTSNHKIGICGQVNSLKCIPSGMTLNNFLFSDQLSPDGTVYATSEYLVNCP